MHRFLGLIACHCHFYTFSNLRPIRGKARLSKLGSSKLRKALYLPAVVAKNHNPILKAFSNKLKSKGKHNMVIIAAVMRKLLHLCFAIIKSNSTFNPNALNP